MSVRSKLTNNSLLGLIIFLVGVSATGCRLATGIFKAGLWIGVILVILVAGLVGIVTWLVRRRT